MCECLTDEGECTSVCCDLMAITCRALSRTCRNGEGCVYPYPFSLPLSFSPPFCVEGYCLDSPAIPPTTWSDVTFLWHAEGYATNLAGILARFWKGSWQQLAETSVPLRAVWAVRGKDPLMPGEAWAVGGIEVGSSSTGRLLHVVPNSNAASGATVTDTTPAGGTRMLHAVFGLAPDDVWFVGEEGTALHWDGSAVTPVATGVTTALRGVWGASSSLVYAVGDDGRLLRFDGAGWNLEPEPPGNDGGYFTSIAGISAAEFAIAGAKLFRNDRGTWSELPNFPSAHGDNAGVTALLYRSATDIWATSAVTGAAGEDDSGRLASWDGRGWTTLESGTTRLWSFAFQWPTVVWATGDDGTWVRLTDGTRERLTPNVRGGLRTVAGGPDFALGFESSGAVRQRLMPTFGVTERWRDAVDAGAGLTWRTACALANGDVIAGGDGAQLYRFPVAPYSSSPWGEPSAWGTPLDGGVEQLECFGSTVVAASSSRVAMCSDPTQPWIDVALPLGFSLSSGPLARPIDVVPETDRFWVSGSNSGFATAVLISDAGVTLNSIAYGSTDAPSLTSVRQVLGRAGTEEVRLLGTTSLDTWLLRLTPPSTINTEQMGYSRGDEPIRLQPAQQHILLEVHPTFVRDLPLDGGAASRVFSFATFSPNPNASQTWDVRCADAYSFGVSVGATCWVYGSNGMILFRRTGQ